MSKIDPDIIKPNILSKFEKVWVKTVFAAFGKQNTIKPFLNFERLFVNQCDNQAFFMTENAKFEKVWVKTVASRVPTRFFQDLT